MSSRKRWIRAAAVGAVGAALLNTLLDTARSLNYPAVELHAQTQALPFYEKCGYQLFGTLEDYPPAYRQFYFSKRLGTG